jgi:hypothetical protein
VTARKAQKPPAGLGERGRRFWDDVTATYALRADELELLVEAARILDLLARLEAEVAAQPLVLPGSKGQARPHPLLSEQRQNQLALATICRQLGLPDHDAVRAHARESTRSSRARRAARERWG